MAYDPEMKWHWFRFEAENMLEALNGFSPAKPIYLYSNWEITRSGNRSVAIDGCYAYESPWAAAGMFRQAIEERGEWRGKGPLIYLFESRLRPAGKWTRPEVAAVVLHEFAHAVAAPPAVYNLLSAGEQAVFDDVQKVSHAANWIRACHHIQYRAARLGWTVPLEAICNTPSEPVGPVLTRIDGEPQRRLSEPLHDVVTGPWPDAGAVATPAPKPIMPTPAARTTALRAETIRRHQEAVVDLSDYYEQQSRHRKRSQARCLQLLGPQAAYTLFRPGVSSAPHSGTSQVVAGGDPDPLAAAFDRVEGALAADG